MRWRHLPTWVLFPSLSSCLEQGWEAGDQGETHELSICIKTTPKLGSFKQTYYFPVSVGQEL